MAHCNTVLFQVVRFFKRHEFESLARKHHVGQEFRSFSRWSQFMAMLVCQLSGRKSLRDIVDNLKAQGHKLYHLGMKPVSRTTLARVNDEQPHTLYKELFYKMLNRCQTVAPKNRLKLDEKVYLLDATMINLCLAAFPWATYRQKKGAIKLHVGLDADGYLPEFVDVTEGKKHEMSWARMLKLPKGSLVVFDRGFTDYAWWQELNESGIFFVTRLKENALVEYFKKRPGRKAKGVVLDQEIALKGITGTLRLVQFIAEDGNEYRFVTNAAHLKAATVADLYKERWKIECFFKWIKQNLRIKTFLGTSENAVLTQLWIALCVYLVLAYQAFLSKVGASMQQILRLLQLNLFERRDLDSLFKPPKIEASPQLALL
ncbi:MAG TPA: IS4 family transposase [Thermoanaerobaculia bacterium]|nr:IS4 family transposase [Thermoanaerobaculia bacterium]